MEFYKLFYNVYGWSVIFGLIGSIINSKRIKEQIDKEMNIIDPEFIIIIGCFFPVINTLMAISIFGDIIFKDKFKNE